MYREDMNQSIQWALEAVAQKNGISAETVRREIEIAIDAARENTDPGVQAFWNALPHKGEVPTPEEVIAYLLVGMRHSS